MRLICLNLQCGAKYESLCEFLKIHEATVDVFCFQEVFNNATKIRWVLENARPRLFAELQQILPDFDGYFAPPREDDVGGLSTFVKKPIKVVSAENIVLFEELNATENSDDPSYFSMGRNLQRVELGYQGKVHTLLNFHGMWIKNCKTDTEKRIEQSQKIRRIFDKCSGPRILCGDLNLVQNTRSVEILSSGNGNLIREWKISNTLSSFDPNFGHAIDYIITSPEVQVENFKVLSDEVSDHLPLLLDFS